MVTNQDLIFDNRQGHRFKIKSEVVARLRQYRQENLDREAGGVLLGRYVRDSDDVIVDKITVPMEGDRRGRRWFFRASTLHQSVLDSAWSDSAGTCNYLGEWHTHAEADPSPSVIDILDWRKRFLVDRIDSKRLFFIIVGTERVNVWQVWRKLLRIEQLLLCG
jgi:integrative and conjugative element protein (TIGR02256 family)